MDRIMRLYMLMCMLTPHWNTEEEEEEAEMDVDDIDIDGPRERRKKRRKEIRKMAAPISDDIELDFDEPGYNSDMDKNEPKDEAPLIVDAIETDPGENSRMARHKARDMQKKKVKRDHPTKEEMDKGSWGIPSELKSIIGDLGRWQKENQKDVKSDKFKFWVLKLPAIISMITSGVFIYLGWDLPLMIATSISGACVIADGVIHPGEMYNAHLRSVHDIGQLVMNIKLMWLIGKRKGADENELVANILEKIKTDFERISENVEGAETKFGEGEDDLS